MPYMRVEGDFGCWSCRAAEWNGEKVAYDLNGNLVLREDFPVLIVCERCWDAKEDLRWKEW